MRQLDAERLRKEIAIDHDAGRIVGLVPTMGALHVGHLSLLRRARVECDRVVISIFVNPLQFGPKEDFSSYPRDLEGDSRLAEPAGADYLFAPEADEMYPRGAIETQVDVGRIGEVVEGHFRPGHFRGVATVCVKLFNIVRPDRAYFGEKDAQQLAVVKQVVRDLGLPLEIVPCATVRDPDGLAMSSRNRHLSPQEREAAAALPQGLFEAKEAFEAGERSARKLEGLVERRVRTASLLRLQYVEVVDPDTFEEVEFVGEEATLALAAIAGGTRLIDNVRLAPH